MNRTYASSLWCRVGMMLILSAGLSGCESVAMQKARRTREQAFDRSVRQVKSLEARRTEKLQQTGNLIQEQLVSDRKQFAEDMRFLADWLPNEVQKWNSKQQTYQEGIRHQLEGRPKSLEETLPHFIY